MFKASPPPSGGSQIIHSIKCAKLLTSTVFSDYIIKTFFNIYHVLVFSYFSRFQYCRYALHVRRCEPNGDGISSFNNLLELLVLRMCVWIVAIITCCGNAGVMLFRIAFKEEHKVHSLFIKNLCSECKSSVCVMLVLILKRYMSGCLHSMLFASIATMPLHGCQKSSPSISLTVLTLTPKNYS